MARGWRTTAFALLAAGFLSSACLLGGDDDDGGASDEDAEENGAAAATATPETTEYVVQAGDTLSGIAAQLDVSLADLQQANDITNANLVQVGQKLIIPSADGTAPPAGTEPASTTIATATVGATATATTTTASASGCDTSYPDVCIPPAPPLLTCDDITQTNFRVVAPDPHNLDQDNNGFGCDE